MPNQNEKDEQKSILKEALKEWLNEKFSEFGKWSLGALAAAFFYAVVYFILSTEGWKKH